jgi:histidinol-phosphate aminotransferase
MPVCVASAAVIRTRSALDEIPVYIPGRSAEAVAHDRALVDVVKLASNEAPFPPLPAAVEAIAAAAASVNRYPDDATVELREALALHHGVHADAVLTANGSVELCRMALAATCDPGEEVLFGSPSFEAYPILAHQVGASPRQIPLRAHHYDLAALADAITERTRLVFVCNPNNPTGTTVGRADVETFLERVPTDLLVVFDEAYREFANAPDFPDGVELVREHANVVALRTFSKAYGLAALRVGYAIGAPDVIGALRKVRVPFATSSLAQVAARVSLAADGEMRARVAEVVAERERVQEAVDALGLEGIRSEANFVWLPLGEHAAVFGDYCERAGLVVRVFAQLGVRVTIGVPAENDRFLRVLRAALEDGAAG